MMENFLYSLEDDFLDFCEPMDYCEDLSSPCSNESDQENHNFLQSDRRLLKAPVKKVQQRKAANLRERRRMKSINDAFDHLRTCIPATVNADRRLSKVDTLRLAIRYIGYLGDLVTTYDDYGLDSQYSRNHKSQEKVILRCQFSDDDTQDGPTLIGHSLSWSNDNTPKPTENKLTAKIWMPENPTESDIINLANYASDYAS
ncbi:pancreas transcription factor 1 subunit alpha-like [Haliotis asinina]|uniref:pancreas transcription factor 1 subunit alpha-like n=1 Tax=Haliotis asinina TaxID=109174 RepID=UPI003531BB4F